MSQPSAFLETLIDFLLPHFLDKALDVDAARAEILETIGSFGARTRAEMLNAARIIAFGMSTLDALREARGPDVSPAMQVRHRGSANALNRSTVQNEKILEKRLSSDPPAHVDPVQPPVADLTDAEVREAISLARQSIQHFRASAPASAPQFGTPGAATFHAAAMRAPDARFGTAASG